MSIFSVRSASSDSRQAVDQLVHGVEDPDPAVIVFFAHVDHDPEVLAEGFARGFPRAQVIGCSGNGSFCNHGHGKTGAVAIALERAHVVRASAALAPLGSTPQEVEAGVRAAAASMSDAFGDPLRHLDPAKHVGLALLEGASGREELINEILGYVAPTIGFVGGSAGDDTRFERTWVVCNGEAVDRGSALMMLELACPFTVLKTCHFQATSREVEVTSASPSERIIYELDGRPAAEFFAEVIERPVAELGPVDFLAHPLGLMIDGKPWLRSIVRTTPDGGLFMACSVRSGTRLAFMEALDFLEETDAALTEVERHLGTVDGAVLFNCAARMFEAEAKGIEPQYHELLGRWVHVGVHSNGESYLAHLNQTLTGLVLGSPLRAPETLTWG